MTNRLVHSTSPYLRQHRDNPVDWFEWSEEAFAEARRRDVPILLSVGYSACHWCHVMAHECFEDVAVAEQMNRLFVNIKVDREERPDVDAIYMDAVQAMTGRGGWPMTVFLTPSGEPFYGGTYFPRDSFIKLMDAIIDVWQTRRDDVRSNVEALMEALSRTAAIEPATAYDAGDILGGALATIVRSFDTQWGGFGGAPKFPSTFAIDLVLRAHVERRDDATRNIVETSLDAMSSGGMYDHLGGGFARYSVDEKWLVPHFEKMLYDQALLIRVYTHAWQVLGHDRYAQVVDECMTYLLREMTHKDGGFFSAQDADSLTPSGHSEEGAFYTWTPDEVRAVLGDDADDACVWWNITPAGNFEGRSIPNRIESRGNLHRPRVLDDARERLLKARAERHAPGLDDKVLTEWNAMMLSTICEAATAFNRSDWLDAARRNAEFLERNLMIDGRWLRSWQQDGVPQARHAGLAHDYAHVVDAFTRLTESTGERRWIDTAISTARSMIAHFWDDVHGGFFTTADDAEQLITRQKDVMDNATPSANSTAMNALQRLAALTGVEEFREYSGRIAALLARVAPNAPSAFCNFLGTLHNAHVGLIEIVVTGNRPDLLTEIRREWRPAAVVAWGEPYESPLWNDRPQQRAFVCRQFTCQAPASTVEDLQRALSAATS